MKHQGNRAVHEQVKRSWNARHKIKFGEVVPQHHVQSHGWIYNTFPLKNS
jgi:hypothetical protein